MVIPCPVVESLAAFEEIVVNGKLGKGSAQPIKEAEELISNGLQNVVYGCDPLRGNVLHLQRQNDLANVASGLLDVGILLVAVR